MTNILFNFVLICLQGVATASYGGFLIYYIVEDEPFAIASIVALSVAMVCWVWRKIIALSEKVVQKYGENWKKI